jgi:Domain of unknown function (DUF4440)
MKWIFSLLVILFAAPSFAQSNAESDVLNVSRDMFRWEVEGKMDSLENLFGDKLVIISSTGTSKSKTEYLNDLKAGKPVHNSIDVQQSSARIIGTTAIVWGKGVFSVSVNENKSTLNLSYMEVFVIQDKNWKLIALHASRLAN